jgi:diguanylate cyclase (GGDEF)-like protein
MLANLAPLFLLASPEPEVLNALEPALLASGARVDIVLSADAAFTAMIAPRAPTVALLDVNLPGIPMAELLQSIRTHVSSRRPPIVLISDVVTEQSTGWLAEGMIHDLIPRTSAPAYWLMRLEQVRRRQRCDREIDPLREGAMLNAQMDHRTGVYNRATILSMLFQETDRVQRMKSSLCTLLFDVDDFGHWNSRLGPDACDELLCQIVGRTSPLLRTYDFLGRPGMDEFLIGLPGCISENAVLLAERLRTKVFGKPFLVAGESIRLSACFGIATSQGRSPMVLREAEQALQIAKSDGPESIRCFSQGGQSIAGPVAFLSSTSGDELLAW